MVYSGLFEVTVAQPKGLKLTSVGRY